MTSKIVTSRRKKKKQKKKRKQYNMREIDIHTLNSAATFASATVVI